ncbi:MAG: glycerophosphodiester phosphodiesterase family protein [Pseudomonadota bacterium]
MAKRFNLIDFAYAHRGLWTANGPAENSLQACLDAAALGLGIEFDVRPSKDGVPIVFHDATLDRMCGEAGRPEDMLATQLIGMPLIGGGTLISFEMLLDAWPQSTPLLCEMKIDGRTDPVSFAQTVSALLSSHEGPAACMSFSRRAVAALPAELMRGQLIAATHETGISDPASTPSVPIDYLACHVSDARHPSLQSARRDLPVITWTVRSEVECADLSSVTDSQIFEGFDPALAKRHILNR